MKKYLGAALIFLNSVSLSAQEKIVSAPTIPVDARQNSGDDMDTVVYTAQKKKELLTRSPVSITSLNGKKIEQYRIWNSKQLSGIVPNLFSSNPGDNRNVTSIRGLVTTSYDPAVATYIDGVNQFNLDTYIADLSDIERIEVLRGPQGTLYGRNAMAGVVNIITKQPSDIANGFVELNAGNYNMQRFTGSYRSPIVKGKLYAGAAASYYSRDGYFTNTFNNSSYDDQHSFTGNYFLKYLPGKNWSVDLNVKHFNNRNKGAFALINGTEAAVAEPFKLSQNALTKMIDNTFNTSVVVKHEGSKVDFFSQTSYQSNYRFYEDPIDGDFAPIDAVSIVNNYGNDFNKVKVFTQEIRFSSDANKKFKWTAGAYAFLLDNPTKQGIYFGEDAGMLGSPQTNFTLINENLAKGFGLAGFAQLNYKLNEKFELIAGVRQDFEKKKLSVEGTYLDNGSGTSMVIYPEAPTDKNFSAFSPKLGAIYFPNDAASVFLTFSKGYRAGGISSLGSEAESNPPLRFYQPEYSSNVEAGWKQSFMANRVYVALTAFYTRVSDVQVPTLIMPDAITVVQNTGKLDSKGFEFEYVDHSFKNLQVDYRLGYTHARFKDWKTSNDNSTDDYSGNRQVFTPDVTSVLGAQYEYPVTRNLKASLRGEWMYFGQQYFDVANTIGQSSYHLLNAKAGLIFKSFELYFWMRNLTDTRYIDYAYDFGAVHLADPKTSGVTFRTKFFHGLRRR
jgi:iron complex outermembrane receptor protein